MEIMVIAARVLQGFGIRDIAFSVSGVRGRKVTVRKGASKKIDIKSVKIGWSWEMVNVKEMEGDSRDGRYELKKEVISSDREMKMFSSV